MNKKTKHTLLSPTLKVEEKKVSLFILFTTQEPRYGSVSKVYKLETFKLHIQKPHAHTKQ